uniref:RHS repeat-associated core domain-containing protein n=1 Tax=Photorhabdus aegyptia TaxID=2805098 RepID=UPI0023ED77F6
LLTWGEPECWPVLTVNDPRNLTCHLRFCGQYEDEESGLFYNRHRYYESDTGQYLSPDPLNLSGGINPYGYVHDPVNWIDPLGLTGCSPSTVMPKKQLPHTVVNELKTFRGKDYHFGNQTFKLDKAGMKHILERHHPDFWDGSVKAKQSFFSRDMSVNNVTDAIGDIMKQNRDTLISKGSIGKYQISGQYKGQDYVVGFKNGRIGQFYPGKL